jgi:DNA-damage-inducible protein J
MDDHLKEQLDMLLEDVGMNMTTAFTVFAKAAVRTWGIPFEVVGEHKFNAATIAAMEETDRILNDPTRKGYDDVEGLLADLRAECTQ